MVSEEARSKSVAKEEEEEEEKEDVKVPHYSSFSHIKPLLMKMLQLTHIQQCELCLST